jgi:transcriptional regulator with XRE-family HTH domain
MVGDSKLLTRFGERLRDLRQAAGLSQEAFAERCGLDRTYISGIERGRRNVSLQNLKLIAYALNTSLSRLFDGL